MGGGSAAEDSAVEALRELLAGPSYTPKKASTRLKQLDWDGGIAERAKILYLVRLAHHHYHPGGHEAGACCLDLVLWGRQAQPELFQVIR